MTSSRSLPAVESCGKISDTLDAFGGVEFNIHFSSQITPVQVTAWHVCLAQLVDEHNWSVVAFLGSGVG